MVANHLNALPSAIDSRHSRPILDRLQALASFPSVRAWIGLCGVRKGISSTEMLLVAEVRPSISSSLWGWTICITQWMSQVTQLLNAIDDGDAQAANQLLPLVYEELRKLAAAKMAQEQPGQ